MPSFIDLIGRRFGKLVVLERTENLGRYTAWVCLCDCGKKRIVRGSSLKTGYTASCGCLLAERNSARLKTHGESRSRLHRIWCSMLNRCRNKNAQNYYFYGGRGIHVCKEWELYQNFRDLALKNGYEDHLQIDRIDNDGNYTPDNCRFVTPQKNSCNRRNNYKVTVNGSTYIASVAARIFNVSEYTIYWWIKNKGLEYAEKRLRQFCGHKRGKR